MPTRLILAVSFLAVLLPASLAEQQNSKYSEGTTVCTFADGKQLSARYSHVPYSKNSEPTQGKPWTPGNAPVYLFTEAPLRIENTTVAPGAYSLYTIPEKKDWTIVINRNVKDGVGYDSSQDLARLNGQTGELRDSSKTLTLYFGRMAPKVCTLRIDYGKQRVFADFQQQ